MSLKGVYQRVGLPPFLKGNESIIVMVHVIEEFAESSIGNCQASASKGCLQLLEVNLPIAVSIDPSKELKELTVGAFDEDAKLYGMELGCK